MNLPAPQMQWIAEHAENGAKVYLQTGALAKDVYLLLPGDENAVFSDNYFDLLPGQETVVNLRTDFAIDEITDKLQIQTLRDTYHSS
jgi:beta-mannosidase